MQNQNSVNEKEKKKQNQKQKKIILPMVGSVHTNIWMLIRFLHIMTKKNITFFRQSAKYFFPTINNTPSYIAILLLDIRY